MLTKTKIKFRRDLLNFCFEQERNNKLYYLKYYTNICALRSLFEIIINTTLGKRIG